MAASMAYRSIRPMWQVIDVAAAFMSEEGRRTSIARAMLTK
jgi:hypothetical protein